MLPVANQPANVFAKVVEDEVEVKRGLLMDGPVGGGDGDGGGGGGDGGGSGKMCHGQLLPAAQSFPAKAPNVILS